MFQETTALRKIRALRKRLRVIQGGSSAGKTIAILLVLIDLAQRRKVLISVVSETVPHLRRGAIRDFKNIMQEHGYWKEALWNESNFIYTFETGAQMEFFSADNPAKVRGPRRDILFINEANNVSYETYTQLAIRTNETIYLDFNPVSEFWAHTDLPRDQMDFIIVTYKDNEGLPKTIVEELESRRGNKRFARVYLDGQIGESEDRIYTEWQVIDEVPHQARLERYGLDFGYSVDPAAIVSVYRYNGGLIFDEETYAKGLSNRQIADLFLNLPQALIVADSAEPKSIDEIASFGLTIVPTKKGTDSVRNGIQAVQSQRISITKRSVNGLKEYRNYFWLRDKNGTLVSPNEPAPTQGDHFLDAARYAVSSLIDFIPDHIAVRQQNILARNEERQALNSSR